MAAPAPSVPGLNSAPDRALPRFTLPQAHRPAPSALPAPSLKPPEQSHFLPALKTFSSFRGAIRRQNGADGAARPRRGAALQASSHAFVPLRMPPGRRAQGPSSPPARRSGSERPRNARLVSRVGPSPVLLGALPPTGEATRSVGRRGGTRPSAACAPGARALRPSGTCRPAPRAPCALWPSLPLWPRPFFLCLRSHLFFFLLPLSSVMLYSLFCKSRSKALQVGEGSLPLANSSLPGGGGRGCSSPSLLPPPALRLLPGLRARCEAQAACWRPEPARSAHAQSPCRPVARLARRPAPPLPASVLPVEGERPGERGSPASSPGGLAEDGDSPARPGHTCSHLCPPVLQGQIVAQLVLLWVSSKLICLYCVEGLEGSRFGGTI